jgi:serine/threonine protein phosphatase PrpC
MPRHRQHEDPLSSRDFCMVPWKENPCQMFERSGIAAVNLKGRKKQDTVGQDSMSISHVAGRSESVMYELFFVADGHGPAAHLVSDRVVQTLPFFLGSLECQELLAQGAYEAALVEAFKYAEQDIMEGPEQCHSGFAGTTASAVLRTRSSDLWVATVGDSRVIMFDPQGSVIYTTEDHTPDLPGEQQRIQAAGGDCREAPPYVGMRVYASGCNYPALAMSRSLGDACAKELGVSAVPEILCWPIKGHEDAYVLVASDGIWEFLENEEVAGILGQALRGGKPPKVAVEALVAKACELWEQHADEYMDDITAILFPVKDLCISPMPGSSAWSECFGSCCLM